MRAKLIKKSDKPESRPKKSKPVAARLGGLVVETRAIVAQRATPVNARTAFAALFEKKQ